MTRESGRTSLSDPVLVRLLKSPAARRDISQVGRLGERLDEMEVACPRCEHKQNLKSLLSEARQFVLRADTATVARIKQHLNLPDGHVLLVYHRRDGRVQKTEI